MSAIPKQEYIEYYRECEEKRYRDFLGGTNLTYNSLVFGCVTNL